MPPKGYCTPADVAALLQITLTTPQQTLANALIAQAEAVIDTLTNRGWKMGEQTLELHTCPGHVILLDYYPIASVAEVRGRTGGMGSAETTLTEGVDYEIYNEHAGTLQLRCSYFDRVRVTYTPVEDVPLDIQRAATELVAVWLQPAILSAQTGGQTGVEVLKLPDLEVKFAKSAQVAAGDVPPAVMDLIKPFRMPVLG